MHKITLQHVAASLSLLLHDDTKLKLQFASVSQPFLAHEIVTTLESVVVVQIYRNGPIIVFAIRLSIQKLQYMQVMERNGVDLTIKIICICMSVTVYRIS